MIINEKSHDLQAISKRETANRSGMANQGVQKTNRTFKTHIGKDTDTRRWLIVNLMR